MLTLEEFKSSREYLFAIDYCLRVKNGEFIPSPIELKNKSNLDRYNKFKEEVISINPIDYKIHEFSKLRQIDVIELFSTIVFMIFGDNEKIKLELTNFISSIQIRESIYNSPLDGTCNKAVNKDTGDVILYPSLPSLDNSSSIICMLHEFTHYHMQYNNISLENKKYYTEILSIYLEKIGLDFLEKLEIEQGITRKIENVRLDCLKYHFKTKEIELSKLYRILRNNNPASKEILDAINIHRQYSNGLTDAYGFGYIYAENLLQMRLTDKNITDNKIIQVMNSEISIQELLDYFGISIKNKNTIECAKRKVRKMTK